MKKKLINTLLIVIIAALSVGGGFLYSKLADKYRREKYPDKYAAEIEAAASGYGLPKAALSALIKVSSDFDASKADEEKGRAGLCMFTEDEFVYLAALSGERTDPRLRYTPEVSIKLGACMLNEFFREFNDWDLVWAAVYGGENYALSLYTDGEKDLTKAEKDTLDFIEKAEEAFETYNSLYPSDLTQSVTHVQTESQTEAEITITQYQ